jgi:hypothetical protein
MVISLPQYRGPVKSDISLANGTALAAHSVRRTGPHRQRAVSIPHGRMRSDRGRRWGHDSLLDLVYTAYRREVTGCGPARGLRDKRRLEGYFGTGGTSPQLGKTSHLRAAAPRAPTLERPLRGGVKKLPGGRANKIREAIQQSLAQRLMGTEGSLAIEVKPSGLWTLSGTVARRVKPGEKIGSGEAHDAAGQCADTHPRAPGHGGGVASWW